MRTDKSIKNAIVAIISNIVLIIVGFISQAVFKNCLGKDYLGLNGLFTSIVSMLSIVELGLGTAIIYHLYKPVAENDIDKICVLMRFYRVSYRVIAIIIICLGFLMMPFLRFFAEAELDENIYYIFGLFVIESAFSYLLSYKRSILYANQENYIVNAIHIGYILSMNIFQIIILINTGNYILYLWLRVIFRMIENVAVTIVANRRYPYINNKTHKIDFETKKDIIVKVKGLFIHKIGSYLVLGTDNIIIKLFINLTVVGIYTSYTMITAGIKNLFAQVFYSITASVGNLLINDKDRAYSVYKNMLFINFWLSGFCSISFYIISKPFVTIWLGSDFVLSKYVVLAIMINLYFDTYGYTIGAFKSAAGIFHEDRWVPALQALVNILISIVMAHYWGLAGVIIGTIVSQMVLYLYSYPKFVYMRLFNRKKMSYYFETLKYLLLFGFIFGITYCISEMIKIDDVFITLIIYLFTCIIIPNTLIYMIFGKSNEYKFFESIVKNRLKKILCR